MTKKIIWADDNQNYRETMVATVERYCRNMGVEVVIDEAPDGKELVEKVLGSNYDLVFTDNRMPNVHGLQAIAQIREQNKTVPIYMVSSSEVGQQAIKVGATGYVDKGERGAFKLGIETAIATHLK